MNTIVLGHDQIIKKSIDDSIRIKTDDKLESVKKIQITISKNTDLAIEYTSDLKTKLDINFNIKKDVLCNITEYKSSGKYKMSYKFDLEENASLNLIKINDVHKDKELIVFNLNGKNSKINYILKTVATNEEKYDVMIYHNARNTISNIINHGVTIDDGEINFVVSGFVPKGIINCVLDQKNRIINLTNNKCEIKPNLFIDENDVIANHSAHIGKCSDDELFYLQSRGINKKEAESLLIKGFLMQKVESKQIEKIIKKYWKF